jgi:hypothetical protein
MANFSPSNLVKAQGLLKDEFTRSEMREKVLPALKLGIANGDPLIPNAAELRKREDRAVSGYMMKRQSRAPLSSRTATHTGTSGDSLELPFTWSTYADVFTISLKQLDTNVFSFEQAMAQNIKNCILNIHAQIETDMVAFLLSNRTQVVGNTTPLGTRTTWNAVNYAWEVSAGDKKQFFQLAKQILFGNKYSQQQFDVIASQQNAVDADFWVNQGAGNAQNTAFQFSGLNIATSTDLTDSNYGNGVSLVMPKASFAIIDWIPSQNRKGYGDYNSYTGGYGSMQDPTGSGLTFAVHGYSLRADTSSINGVAQDNQMQFEISVDIASALSPLSTATESVVYEIAQQ